ncbi:hypothetical protein Tco_0399725 [Tanacetum coccineum]
MDSQSTQTIKLPILQPGEYDLWKMMIEQYLQCIDYTLWEIVENGNAPIVTKIVDGKETVIPPTSVEEKAHMYIMEDLQNLFGLDVQRPKAVLSAVKGNKGNAIKASACWVWRPKHKILDHGNPQQDFKDKGVIDSGCFRHMTGNRSYLIDYEEIDRGFVAFGDFKLTEESHVLLKVPRKDNMYSVDLKNDVSQGGRKPALSFMRPFWCPVTILNTIDHLGSGPNWLFDIDALTNSMNYKPVVIGNQSNGNVGTKACDDTGKARVETVPGKDYILLPLWTQDPPLSSSPKDSPDVGFKPLGEEEKIDADDSGNEGGNLSEEGKRINQEKDASVNNTNNINTVSLIVNAASIEDKVVNENIVYRCADDPNIHDLEETGRFSDAENDDSGADINNLNTYF